MPPLKGRVVISHVYCKGCELCVAGCPQHVLATDAEHITPQGYHPAYLIGDGCTGCALCAVICPEAAITVYREVKPKAPEPKE
jgi:2-oxoglutarate ferredoxin oxidoreductase subunit delta